jgi:cohesin domain-containing protein
MMNLIRLATVTIALAACQDQPARTTGPTPPPPQQGVAAYVTVDRLDAPVGATVRVRVEVQVGTQQNFLLGSYTGRLHFDPAALQFQQENPISDGLRIANPANAAKGEIRFAGASASGFASLVLYDGTFTVKSAGYASGLSLMMEEMSAAKSLTNLRPQLNVSRQIFLSRVAEH